MESTIRRWGITLPRPRWIKRLSAPLEGMTLEELALTIPAWGSSEVQFKREADTWPRHAPTSNDWILMERMGRPR